MTSIAVWRSRAPARAALTVAAGLTLALVVPHAALAATVDVTVANFSFTPKTVKVPQGTVVRWTNQGPNAHTSTGDSTNPDGTQGLSLWNSGVIPVGGNPYTRTFSVAGGFPYHCSIHPTMKGTVTVTLKGPNGGTVGQAFTIVWAAANLPMAGNLRYDVQRKDPGGNWTTWKPVTVVRQGAFTPNAPGTYSFRARLVRVQNGVIGGRSLFSPAKSVMVQAA